MIPKVIHYCWFGGKPLPESADRYIESWKKHFPDYEIVQWNESNFDVESTAYTKEAYQAGKYAFVSDYARFWVLYNYGGVYFDTDVEVIAPMDDILEKGPFMGCERTFAGKYAVAPGLGIAAVPKMEIYEQLLKMYDGIRFLNEDGSLNQVTIVSYTTELLCRYGFVAEDRIQHCAGMDIYPVEYFCPLDYRTGVLTVTENTRTIHHYAASWHSTKDKFIRFKRKIFSEEQIRGISRFLDRFRKRR